MRFQEISTSGRLFRLGAAFALALGAGGAGAQEEVSGGGLN